MLKRSRIIISLVIIVASLVAISFPSGMQPAAADNEGVNLPPIGDLERGNPKLAGVLVRLIQAEKQGKAESFARQRVIQLQDDNVFVTIKSVPGQAEAAAKAATSAGAKIGRPTKTCWMHLCL